MRRAGMLLVLVLTRSALVAAQSPAPSSHVAVDRAIAELNETLKGPTPGGAEAAPGWAEFLNGVKAELANHDKATTFADRLAAFRKLVEYNGALATVDWAPASNVRAALDGWVAPRARVAESVESLRAFLNQTAASPEEAENRKGWIAFLDAKLGGAIKAYESAATVQARAKALEELGRALTSLEKSAAWDQSAELIAAIKALHVPNFDVTADPNSLAKQFSREVVQSGPVERKGYVSQVTAGQYLGFGLFASDEGIGFYNAQAYSNYTPIWDFQQQMRQDPRGRRVANLYEFNVASVDSPSLTVMTLLSPSGLRLWPQFSHNVDMLVGSSKVPGKGLQRGILSLIGMNQSRINQKVYENGVGKIRDNVEKEALEESTQKMAQAEAEQNAKLSEVLVGNRTAVVKDFAVTELEMRSRPDHAFVGGKIGWHRGENQLGADLAQPPAFQAIASGIAADLNPGSILSNIAHGFWGVKQVSEVETLLVEVRPIEKSEKPGDGISYKTNATFADFSKAVTRVQELKNPKAVAVWVRKPKSAPKFGVDARGNLVVMIPDFQIDVPVPAQLATLANNARILRLQSPMAEFVIGIESKPGASADSAPEIAVNVKEFIPGPGAKVMTIGDDESKAAQLDMFRAPLIFAGFGRVLASLPLKVPTERFDIPGYRLQSVSPLDPTGWIRVVLSPKPEAPAAEAAGGQ